MSDQVLPTVVIGQTLWRAVVRDEAFVPASYTVTSFAKLGDEHTMIYANETIAIVLLLAYSLMTHPAVPDGYESTVGCAGYKFGLQVPDARWRTDQVGEELQSNLTLLTAILLFATRRREVSNGS